MLFGSGKQKHLPAKHSNAREAHSGVPEYKPSTDCSYLARSTCLKGNSAIPSKVRMLGIGTWVLK